MTDSLREIKCVHCAQTFGTVDRETSERGCRVRGAARRTRWWHRWTRRNANPDKDWCVWGLYENGVLIGTTEDDDD